MSELYQSSIPNINMHVRSIYEEDELHEEATIKDFLIVQKMHITNSHKRVDFYNLEITVGHHVNSN